MKKVLLVALCLLLVAPLSAEDDKPHEWWSRSDDWIQRCFDKGVNLCRERVQISELSIEAKPDRRIQLGSDMELISASIGTPLTTVLSVGWSMESRKAPQSERDTYAKNAAAVVNKKVGFSVYVTSESNLDAPNQTTFAAETDKGVLLKAKPTNKPMITVGSGRIHSWYNCHWFIDYELTDDKGKLAVTSTTKWLKLWIVSPYKRASATFYLDDSMKAKAQAER